MTAPSHLFVYGTLMRGYDHPMARMLEARATWLGRATCHGRLYRIAHYPGLVLSDDPAAIVHGDVFALPDDGGALLTALDDYEGCGTNDPLPHPYRRVMIDLMRDNGSSARAETYEFLLPVREDRRIVEGQFF